MTVSWFGLWILKYLEIILENNTDYTEIKKKSKIIK